MKTSRRDFLKTAGAFGALAVAGCDGDTGAAPLTDAGSDTALTDAGSDTALPGPDAAGPDTADVEPPPPLPEYEYDGPLGPEDLYQHAVASGDPLPDAVILWTRLTGASDEPTEVFWEVAHDAGFTDRVAADWTDTGPDRDWTVKVDATGLAAGTDYFFRFHALGRTSPVGHTRTAPAGTTDRVRFAVCSCSNYSNGYFIGYRAIAEADVDAVLHLGDYIYESAGSGALGRGHQPPHEIVTLDDYRQRYAQYRTDPDLQAMHSAHPVIPVWDDHESANNAWRDGAQAHDPFTEGLWSDRKAAAVQAWREWLPVRDAGDLARIHRRLAYGDLVDLIMLDTRLWGRDLQLEATDEHLADPTRTLLGAEQEAWLNMQLTASTARWRVLGQQVMLTPLTAGGQALNSDQWDGYPAARERLLQSLVDGAIDNVIVLTGDIHSSWAAEVPLDKEQYVATGEGAVAVEFVAPGITSGFPLGSGLVDVALQLNPQFKYGEVDRKGFFVLDITADSAQAAWFLIDDVTNPETTPVFDAAFTVHSGTNRLTEDPSPR